MRTRALRTAAAGLLAWGLAMVGPATASAQTLSGLPADPWAWSPGAPTPWGGAGLNERYNWGSLWWMPQENFPSYIGQTNLAWGYNLFITERPVFIEFKDLIILERRRRDEDLGPLGRFDRPSYYQPPLFNRLADRRATRWGRP